MNKGIFGGYSGKVGSTVGTDYGGKYIIRTTPKKSSKAPTEAQLNQRKKFKAVVRFLNPIKNIVGKYFGLKQGDKSIFNLATAYFLTEVVVPDGDNFVIDYPRVLISKGDLQGMADGAVSAGVDQSLDLTWFDNSGQTYASATDKLIVVVYVPQMKIFKTFNPAAQRDAASVNLQMPGYMSAMPVEVYATFVTEDDLIAATSSYLGQVTLS